MNIYLRVNFEEFSKFQELLQIQEQQSEILHEVHQARTSGLWPSSRTLTTGRTLRMDSHQPGFGRHSPQPPSLLQSHAQNANLNMSHGNLSSHLSILTPQTTQSSHLSVLQTHSAPLSPLGGLTSHSRPASPHSFLPAHSRSASPHSVIGSGPHSLPASHSLLIPSHSSAASHQSLISGLSTPSHHSLLHSHQLPSTTSSHNLLSAHASMYSHHHSLLSPNSLLLSQPSSLGSAPSDVLDHWDGAGSVAHKIRAALTGGISSGNSSLLLQARNSPAHTPSRDVRSATLKLAALRTREKDTLYATQNPSSETDASILELLNNFQIGKT